MRITTSYMVAETVIDVLLWIETASHQVASEITRGQLKTHARNGKPEMLVSEGLMLGKASQHSPSHCIRIPKELQKKIEKLIKPNTTPFDTRMYRANAAGREILSKAMHMPFVEAVQNGKTKRTLADYLRRKGLLTDGRRPVKRTPVAERRRQVRLAGAEKDPFLKGIEKRDQPEGAEGKANV